MIMKRSILTVLFLLCAWPLLAVDAEVSTSVLRGKVVDAKTKEPIQYVNVVVRKAGTQTQVKGAVTDQTGMFRLEGLTSNPAPKKDWLDEGKKTDRISFLRKDYQYRKNLTRIFNAEMGTNVPENKNDTRYLDGLEPDFKQ